jgi:transcriptional regulator with XRE-family HTH domain
MFTGENLRQLRLIKGMKQKFVASKLGISQQAYSKLENRDVITDHLLLKVMQSMDCKPEEKDIIEQLVLFRNK